MKTVIIDRQTWRRGDSAGGFGYTALLDHHNRQCCLGFACEQLAGVGKIKLLDLCEPYELEIQIKPLTEIEGDESIVNTDFSSDAMHINDSRFRWKRVKGGKKLLKVPYDDWDREHDLYVLGLKHGVKFKFIN